VFPPFGEIISNKPAINRWLLQNGSIQST